MRRTKGGGHRKVKDLILTWASEWSIAQPNVCGLCRILVIDSPPILLMTIHECVCVIVLASQLGALWLYLLLLFSNSFCGIPVIFWDFNLPVRG